MADQPRNPLDGLDIEGAINRHYDKIDQSGGAFSGSAEVVAPAAAFQPPVPQQQVILGGHEDHDHAPLVINAPYIIFEYGQNEEGEGTFSLNVAGVDGGILGTINQLKETIGYLENEIAEGRIPVN